MFKNTDDSQIYRGLLGLAPEEAVQLERNPRNVPPSRTGFQTTEFQPHLNKYLCIPPDQNESLVPCPEDVPGGYTGLFTPAISVLGGDDKLIPYAPWILAQGG